MRSGDFNRDGKRFFDLVTANPEYFGSTVSVLLGNGDGTFEPPQHFATGLDSDSVAVGDFNGDGKLDLALANEFSNTNTPGGGAGTVSVLLGNGDGTFQTAQNIAYGFEPGSVVVADFNSDGKPDLAVAIFSTNTTVGTGSVSVLLGNGDGTFQTAQNFADSGTPGSIAIGDFNHDGKLDLAAANAYDGKTGGAGDVSVLLGNGDGTFQTAQNIAVGFEPGSVVVADFNSDGKPDLAVLGGGFSVLLGNGDGTFQTAQNIALGIPLGLVAVADFNSDGKPDLAMTSSVNNIGTASVLLNQRVTTTAVSGPTSSTYAQSVTYTASVTSGTTPAIGGTITFLDGAMPLSPALPVDANGQATFSFASLDVGSHTITASYASGSPGGAGITGFGASTGTANLTVNPAPLSATGVNSSATAGAPFTGTVATFVNADPFGSATSYTAIITWGDGSTSAGTVTGTGSLTVSGSHTYADPGTDVVSVQISHNLGDTTTATATATAAVVILGQVVQPGLAGDIAFWRGKSGQALINSFNGGSFATDLSSWLGASFPNLYGAGAGVNLIGEENAQVAAFYKTQFALPDTNVQVQILATALDLYATTQSLGGATGQAYGFTVSAAGLGPDSFTVGADGAALGLGKKTTWNVYELLKAADRQAVFGVPYNGDATLQKKANHLFRTLIDAGSIS